MAKVFLTVHDAEIEKIGDTIAGALGERHLKQKDVAKRLGKAPSTISNMLGNIENMKVGDLLRLCEMTNRKVEITRRGQ